jgi:hypothetical protein
MKNRYLMQQYKNFEDFQNAANALALDGYIVHSFNEYQGLIAVVYQLEQPGNQKVQNMIMEQMKHLEG